MIQKLFVVIKKYQDIALTHGCLLENIRGGGTAVFRNANNGSKILRRIQEEFGINVRCISQQEEGEIGFLTAVGSFKDDNGRSVDRNKIICWDTGGASYQITTPSKQGYHVYEGCLGSSS